MKAVELCEASNVEYTYTSVDTPDNLELFKELFPGVKTVPQIIYNYESIGGYTELKQRIFADAIMNENHELLKALADS